MTGDLLAVAAVAALLVVVRRANRAATPPAPARQWTPREWADRGILDRAFGPGRQP